MPVTALQLDRLPALTFEALLPENGAALIVLKSLLHASGERRVGGKRKPRIRQTLGHQRLLGRTAMCDCRIVGIGFASLLAEPSDDRPRNRPRAFRVGRANLESGRRS